MAGFGGMREHGVAQLRCPLPQQLSRLAFRLLFRGYRICVAIDHQQAWYALLQGAPLDVVYHGVTVALMSDEPATCLIPEPPSREAPTQPPGRAPALHRPT